MGAFCIQLFHMFAQANQNSSLADNFQSKLNLTFERTPVLGRLESHNGNGARYLWILPAIGARLTSTAHEIYTIAEVKWSTIILVQNISESR